MDWRRQRGIDGGIQMTFQDAFESFDPRWTVRHSLLEACEASGASWNKALVTLSSLGVSQEGIDVLPGGLSTGAQKVLNLVRAVVAGAQLLVADEPTSGLDLTARRRMASAMRKLAVDEDVTLVIISHDMAFVRHLTQNIHVMYLGDIVEQGPTSEVFRRPMHPYTKALLAASLRERSVKLSGEIPSPTDRSAGCPLAGRCPFAEERCSEPQPMVGAGPHSWACWKANAIERDAMTGGSSKPQ
jgi:oligopeptide/dipeptide ABC transporter ATP-binding protein